MSQEPIKAVKNRAYELLERLEAAREAGEIDEDGWYREGMAVLTPAYLAADNPRGQSGHSGDDAHWQHARSLIGDGSGEEVVCGSKGGRRCKRFG